MDHTYTLGDFVISGGELSTLVLADTMVRLLPEALGHKDSAACDSFGREFPNRLEHPQYTRPIEFEGAMVPSQLTSGDHKNRLLEGAIFRRTNQKLRPDLIIKD